MRTLIAPGGLGGLRPTMRSTNETVARLLDELALREELKGTRYKPRAYERAARNIRELEEDVARLSEQGRLKQVEGIGDAIAAKIEEALETGTIQTLEGLREEIPVDVVTLSQIRGLGTKKLKALYEKLEIQTLEDLERAASEGAIARMRGFGEKTQETILAEIERVEQTQGRFLMGKVLPFVEDLVDRLQAKPAVHDVHIAGVLRRRVPLVTRVDLVATAPNPRDAIDAFVRVDPSLELVQRTDTSAELDTPEGLPITLTVVEPDELGARLLHETGTPDHIDALATRAGEKGFTLTARGLLDRAGQTVAGTTEDTIYAVLDLPWIPAEIREGLGEVQAAEDGELPELVTLEDIRGDLQMHTTYSDGATSVRGMAEKAQALGYDYILVTDHGPSLTVAGAPSLEELAQQGEEIAKLNEDPEMDVTILHGVEANITADGMDVPAEVCEELDLVVASLHDHAADATERVLHALEAYPVDILGHPSNRLLLQRDGNELAMEPILEAAAEHRVAIEINAQPSRLGLDWHLVRRYRDETRSMISTDAHHPDGMELMRYGVDQARKGWLTSEHVLNAQPLDELVGWLRG